MFPNTPSEVEVLVDNDNTGATEGENATVVLARKKQKTARRKDLDMMNVVAAQKDKNSQPPSLLGGNTKKSVASQ